MNTYPFQAKHAIIACFLFLSSSVFAQEPICKWGKPLPNEKPDRELTRIFAHDNTGYYAMREKIQGFSTYQWIEKYRTDFTLEYSNEITTFGGVVGDGWFYNGFHSANGKFFVLTEHWQKGKSSNELGYRLVSKEGVKSDDFQPLCKITATKMGNRGKFIIDLSDDNKKMAVLREHPFEKGGGEKISVTVFETATMKEIWNKDITLSTPSSKTQWHTLVVANDGSIYVYKKTHVKKVYTYSLFSTDSKGGGWKEHGLSFGDKKVEEISLSFNSKQDFIVCGLYYLEQRGSDRPIIGRFYFRIDGTTKKLAANSFSAFTVDMLKDFIRGGLAEKGGTWAGVKNLKLKAVLPRSNGSVLMLTEVNKRTRTAIAGTSPIQYTYTHSANAIAVFCIKEDGSEDWYTPVFKNHQFGGKNSKPEWTSFVYLFKDDALTFMWNDTYLNTTPPLVIPHKWSSPDGAVHINRRDFPTNAKHAVFMAVIEPNGTSRFKDSSYGLPLFKLYEKAIFPMSLKSHVFYQVGNALIIVAEMSGEGKRYKLGKIKL